MVTLSTYSIYFVKCDKCGCLEKIERGFSKVYNRAQAVRFFGWSFGRDGQVRCFSCRKSNRKDHYRFK